jgi:hypothetical protein
MNSPGKSKVIAIINAKITPCIVLAAILWTFTGCGGDSKAPDVSHLDGNFNLLRSEQILFPADTTALPDTALFNEHPHFWELYFTAVMSVSDTSQRANSWQKLARDPYLRAIADSVAQQYHDMTDIQNQLSTAFQYLQYYFPGNRVPNVYTLISGFGYFPFIFEDEERDGLGISLEMFLGADFPYRTFTGNANAFSDYLIRSYNRDHLAKRTVDVLVDDLIGQPPGDRLIDLMIHNGIRLYITEHLMPEVADTVLFEFTPQQLEWCESNERNLWAHFLKEDLLYSNEFSKVQKLVNPAPGIPGMPPEAPGGVANWTGWRIIHALMERNPDSKMIDLLSIQDPQALLEAARYRPR